MDNTEETAFDKAAYLAKIDDIINNSLLATENKTKNKIDPYEETRSFGSHSDKYFNKLEYNQEWQLKYSPSMASPDSPEDVTASTEKVTSPSQSPPVKIEQPDHFKEEECEEGEIEDSQDSEEEEEEGDDEYCDSEGGQGEEIESSGEEEYYEEEYEHWEENEKHEDENPVASTSDAKPSKDSLDNNISMNLESLKKSAINKQDKQEKLKRQIQDLCCRVVREFQNSVKLTVLKEKLHTNMEKLTKVLTAFDRVFSVFTLHGCAHVRILPQLELCDAYCSRSGCGEEDCSELHVCKFYLLGLKCQYGRTETSCRYGHALNSDHNTPLLSHHFLDKLDANELVGVLRQRRTHATVPKVCKHYNFEKGCRHNAQGDGCVALHVCKYYVKGECRFKEGCMRSHNLEDEQPAALLGKCGLDPTDSETCTRLSECSEKGFFIMPYIPFVRPKPMRKHWKQPKRKLKAKKPKKKKKSKMRDDLQIRIHQDVPSTSNAVAFAEDSFPPIPNPGPRPRFRPPFPPQDPFFRPSGPMRHPFGPFGPIPGPMVYGPNFPGPPMGPLGPVMGPPVHTLAPPREIIPPPGLLPPPPPGLLSTPPPGLLPNPPPGPSTDTRDFLSPPPDEPSEFERRTSRLDSGRLLESPPGVRRHSPLLITPDFEKGEQDFPPPSEQDPEFDDRFRRDFSPPRHRADDALRPGRDGVRFEEEDRRDEAWRGEERAHHRGRRRDRSPPGGAAAWSSTSSHDRDEQYRRSPRKRRDSDRDWREMRSPRKRSMDQDWIDDRTKFPRIGGRDEVDERSRYHAPHSHTAPHQAGNLDAEGYGPDELDSFPISVHDLEPTNSIWTDQGGDDIEGGASHHETDQRDARRNRQSIDEDRLRRDHSDGRLPPHTDAPGQFRRDFQDDDAYYAEERHRRRREERRDERDLHRDIAASEGRYNERRYRPDAVDPPHRRPPLLERPRRPSPYRRPGEYGRDDPAVRRGRENCDNYSANRRRH